MKIYSFSRDGLNLVPFEVEVSFMPGLPKIEIMGQPDQVIKESQLRIKSALQQQGYTFPKAKQILVNLKPSYMKKKSQGLDLAIACAFLFASKQVLPPTSKDNIFVFGELGLDGKVYQPEDFDILDDLSEEFLLSGVGGKPSAQSYYGLKELKDLVEPIRVSEGSCLEEFKRPEVKKIYVNQTVADLIKIVAVGGHSCLLAGPAGSGKSTLMEVIPAFLPEPDRREAFEIMRMSRLFQQVESWRPLVTPHHSTPTISMVGGGMALAPGEISRAHHGVLGLDELLEFSSVVKEALREPIEKGEIQVARRSKFYTFPCRFLLLATTNLCPCGDMVPGKMGGCRFSLRKCQSYVEKLSGPLLDRFQVLSYSHTWSGDRTVYLPEILPEVLQGQKFCQQERGQSVPNGRLSLAELTRMLGPKAQSTIDFKSFKSHRRKIAVLRVARTLADLAGSEKIEYAHVLSAYNYSDLPFSRLKNIFS